MLTACLWSGSSIAFASATRRLGSVRANVARLIFAAVFLLLLVLLAGFDLHLSRNQIFYLSFSGMLGITLGDSFLFKAYQKLGARITSLVMALNPGFAAVLGLFILGEGISMIGVLGITITVGGVAIVVSDRRTSGGGNMKYQITAAGVVLALLAAAGQGSGLVMAKMAFRESPINGFVATTVRVLASLVPLLPAAIITGRFRQPVRTFINDRRALGLTITGSILGPFLGITFSLIAIEQTTVGVAATIMALVPVLMLPLVRIIYKERLSWRAVAGAFVAVGGVAMLFLR